MNRLTLTIFTLVGITTLSGCSMSVLSYEHESPRFVPEEWFIGSFTASGGFFDRFGALRRRFTMDLEGRRDGDKIILHEVLKYTDGEVATRTYEIRKTSENHYEAFADGVVGSASIESSGNALRWQYRLKQSIDGSDWTLTFDDWMYLIDDTTMLDRAEVSKFGIKLGEVVLVAKKHRFSDEQRAEKSSL